MSGVNGPGTGLDQGGGCGEFARVGMGGGIGEGIYGSGCSRRDFLKVGGVGLTLPGFLGLREASAARLKAGKGVGSKKKGFGQAKRCIILFAWGGLSHLDTWDMKPDAPGNIRGIFKSIKTKTPGLRIGEHTPLIAKQTHRMAFIRSMHHNAPSHRSGAYWNLTGHEPPNLKGNWKATRKDWPSIGSMVAEGMRRVADQEEVLKRAMPWNVALPYPMYDGGRANGQDGGFMGMNADPIIVKPKKGTPYQGKSPDLGWLNMSYAKGLGQERLVSRRGLLESLELAGGKNIGYENVATVSSRRMQERAMDMMLDGKVRDAFRVENEPEAVRAKYGDHICGQSVLLARKLVEAGVPIATVYCAAGDLNGSKGAHFDTHANNFNRLKGQMLPPLDRASYALLEDLSDRGMLDDTLVVWLTEFGRTPRINGGAGRDHYPNCYTVALAGAGIAGGMVYGSSDKHGAFPDEDGCGPADLHATIFHAMGIEPHFEIYDGDSRPLPACDGEVLGLY